MAEQGVSVTCEGGLDLVGTTHTLFRTPGVATKLENYESSIHVDIEELMDILSLVQINLMVLILILKVYFITH